MYPNKVFPSNAFFEICKHNMLHSSMQEYASNSTKNKSRKMNIFQIRTNKKNFDQKCFGKFSKNQGFLLNYFLIIR